MTNAKAQMSNADAIEHPRGSRDEAQSSNDKKKKYDLEERTAQFGQAIIELVKTLPHDPINSPLISQIVRAGTSIGANYMEADGAESRKDFRHRISICKKSQRRRSIGSE